MTQSYVTQIVEAVTYKEMASLFKTYVGSADEYHIQTMRGEIYRATGLSLNGPIILELWNALRSRWLIETEEQFEKTQKNTIEAWLSKRGALK